MIDFTRSSPPQEHACPSRRLQVPRSPDLEAVPLTAVASGHGAGAAPEPHQRPLVLRAGGASAAQPGGGRGHAPAPWEAPAQGGLGTKLKSFV